MNEEHFLSKVIKVGVILLFAILLPHNVSATNISVNLSGKWSFQFDPTNTGVNSRWYGGALTDSIQLPGTTEEAKKGVKSGKREIKFLTRVYPYSGAAWYQKEINIPAEWMGKHITFEMERTKTSTVWLDNMLLGSQNSLTTAHVYDLSKGLKPGKHLLTVCVDNMNLPPVGDPHQLSDQTQTNWNGIIGKIELKVTDPVWIANARVIPDVQNGKAKVMVQFARNANIPVDGQLLISGASFNTNNPQQIKGLTVTCKADTAQRFSVEVPIDNVQLWDEFNPALYKLNITFKAKYKRQIIEANREVTFGMREFTTKGSQFTNNGKIVFLRGKHDACVFPLTGYPPMTVDGWLRVFKIARSYGINHYRFHTWCPPAAAFEAADIAGIYMQPELPGWGSIGKAIKMKGDVEQKLDNDPVESRTNYLTEEGLRILKAFGNNPSFVMFSLGNEMTGSMDIMAGMINTFRQYDNTKLYAQGSNNFLMSPRLVAGDNYWTTMFTAGRYSAGKFSADSKNKEVRGSSPSHVKGHVNNEYNGTMRDYIEAIKGIPVPVIGHEIGQYEVFPNFKEITKYTGVVRARNFEVFHERLEKAGMIDQADDFFKASGALSVICYREEIETALRTPGFGGFQLLDLQDFPGQGTALVGILDAFMDSKGLITPEEWRNFCNSTVPLIRMKSYTWDNSATFTAEAQVAHYGSSSIENANGKWRLTDAKGNVIQSGTFPGTTLEQGQVCSIGNISVPLNSVTTSQKLTLTLEVNEYHNSYPVWVYANPKRVETNNGILVTRNLDDITLQTLDKGEKVLFIADTTSLRESIGGAFITDFWCYPMFKKYSPPGTMGLLCNPNHPALKGFPTEFHSDWQWWSLAKKSPVMILNNMPFGFKPIVQVIDNFERNNKLGLLFEVAVGKGKLMVSSMDLTNSENLPEITCLRQSVMDYMKSAGFNPTTNMDKNSLMLLFK